MSLPVTVVVPHVTRRRLFFMGRALPSIVDNDPEQIVIVPNDGKSGCSGYYRNQGFRKVASKYVFFVDDDTILLPGCIRLLVQALEAEAHDVGFAYCDWRTVVHPGAPWSGRGGAVRAGTWDKKRLFKNNYISNMSLIKSSVFPLYDDTLRRLVDWDLWLRLAKMDYRGVYVPEILFEAHQIDESATSSVSDDAAIAALRERHVDL